MGEQRIREELNRLKTHPIKGCSVGLTKAGDIFNWKACITGPCGTPYENGAFFLSINFPQNYPFNPPSFKFTTKVYHMNINDDGNVKLGLEEWNSDMSLEKILVQICDLFVHPNHVFPLIPEYAFLYQTDPNQYVRNCSEYVSRYAS